MTSTLIFAVILISGGRGDGDDGLNSTEIYLTGTSGGKCRIANMPISRFGTVTKDWLVCGGWSDALSDPLGDCVRFNPESGRWDNAHKLNQSRAG